MKFRILNRGPRCAYCDKRYQRAATGRPAKYCSDKCRVYAWRERVPNFRDGRLNISLAESQPEWGEASWTSTDLWKGQP